ncbi:MAG: thiolase family protein [Oceanicaulis sp.]
MAGEAIAYVPYGAYWSTPFARWQGALSGLHSVKLAAHAARQAFAKRGLDIADMDSGVLGLTVPQEGSFYGLPWLGGMIGAERLAGPTISQACATGARVLETAAREVASGASAAVLGVCADRTSNSPHIYYPAPDAPGGVGRTEDWILANFERDPHAGLPMVDTAENVARRFGVSRADQDDILLLRQQQYDGALENDRAFQRRYMLDLDLPDARFSKSTGVLAGDEGVYPSNPEKVRALKPVREGGTVTLASQTHPADGNAGIVVAGRDTAKALSSGEVEAAILGFGQAREEAGYMPAAPVPASRRALAAAGIKAGDLTAVTSHNPFAVNDLVFARALGLDPEMMNRRGCSLIYGHPQGPTGMRAIIELIETLVEAGGGYGLFQGCAAGDSAMALVIRVDG